MLPLQPGGGVDPAFAANELAALHSHNCPTRAWPALDALRALERIPLERIAPFAGRPPLFVQLQALERGAVIAAHVDEPGVGGRAIATTVIAGASCASAPSPLPSAPARSAWRRARRHRP